MVPDSTLVANHRAAHALAQIIIPNCHVTAEVGHANAFALGIIPEFAFAARFTWYANPVTDFGAPVSMVRVGSSTIIWSTFAGAAFSIIILVSIALRSSSWVASARAPFHVPVLVSITQVTLLVALALAVFCVPIEAIVAHARSTTALATGGIEILVDVTAGNAWCAVACAIVRVVDVVSSIRVERRAVKWCSYTSTSALIPEPVTICIMCVSFRSFKSSVVAAVLCTALADAAALVVFPDVACVAAA